MRVTYVPNLANPAAPTLAEINAGVDMTHLFVNRHEEAMRRGAHAFRRFNARIVRLADSKGDRHIERILRDCIAKRQDVETTARRLMVATDIAQVLDTRPCRDCGEPTKHLMCIECERDRDELEAARNAEWWA